MRLLMSGLGRPGRIVAKSMMNSLCEWVMIARFEYVPFATSGRISRHAGPKPMRRRRAPVSNLLI